MPLLEVDSVSKAFGATQVLGDVSFQISQGEIVCLLGPSGCGKTTLLRVIAGLETADAGHVIFEGRRLDRVPVHVRGFGLMFQDFALFPHKDVAANVAFGLRMQRISRHEVASRVTEMLDLVGLAGYESRRVFDLSGGEQQRVALARSLAPGPRLLMLDEPLGSLDRALREELMNDLRTILQQVGVTALYVTHDQQEAFALADRLLIMKQGHIVQQGHPQSTYRYPASAWVARFLGLSNLLPGRIVALREAEADGSQPERLARTAEIEPVEAVERGSPEEPVVRAVVETPLGRLEARLTGKQTALSPSAGQAVTVLLRPEGARLAEECPDEGLVRLSGVTSECSFRGSQYRLVVDHSSGQTLAFELVATASDLPRPGQPVRLALHPEAVSLILEEPGDRR